MVLGRYLECDVRVDTQEKIAGEKRKKKKEEKEDKAFSSAERNGRNRREKT